MSLTKRGFNRIQKGLNIFPIQDLAAFYGEVRSQGYGIPPSQRVVVLGFQQNIMLDLQRMNFTGF